jgi:hypothetical protein
MFHNALGYRIGKLLPPVFHSLFSRMTGWMFAAVWLRDRQRHQWMWVNQERYYSGELQSLDHLSGREYGRS